MASLYAQPILQSDSLYTGQSFNLYSLAGVNVANLTPVGANVSWDISTAIATLAGTADFEDMASTPYAVQYPAANFAIKFTMGATPFYSLFIKSASKLEEVANNVGAAGVDFLDYRTALVFPFTYNFSDNDTYQKTAQSSKTIVSTYTGYGSFISNPTTYPDAVQVTIVDDGNTKAMWWNSSPVVPLLQAENGFVLWKQTITPTTVMDYYSNDVFDLYPNPANNTLQVVNKDLIQGISIYNFLGQLQLTTTASCIDISMLAAGTYVLKATTTKGCTSQQFIKK